MPTAFVLLNAELGSDANVLRQLKKLKAVEEAFNVYGTYDLIAKVKADSMDELNRIITSHIRGIEKVRSTLTLMTVEETKH